MTIREAICDRLTRLGVPEMSLHALLLTLDTWDLSGDAMNQARLGRTVLWIAMTPSQAQRDNARLEAFGQISRSAPMMRFASPEEVMDELRKGRFGIAINVADIIGEGKDA